MMLVGFEVSTRRKTPGFFIMIAGTLRDNQYINNKTRELLEGSWKDATNTAMNSWVVKVSSFHTLRILIRVN